MRTCLNYLKDAETKKARGMHNTQSAGKLKGDHFNKEMLFKQLV